MVGRSREIKPFALLVPLVLATASPAHPRLGVGSPAPSLASAVWIKGTRPASFRDGKVHVVDFWATWCAACVEGLPHLSSLAKRYGSKVDVSAISVWELNHLQDKHFDYMPGVRSFVAEEGAAMGFNVGADRPDHTIDKLWMQASGSGFIPTAFIVDRKGRIAWIGNSFDMDAALDAVVRRSGDPVVAARLAKKRQQKDEDLMNQAARRGDIETVLKVWKRLPPTTTPEEAFGALLAVDPQGAVRLGQAVLDDQNAGMWQCLLLVWEVDGQPAALGGCSPTLRSQLLALAVRLGQAGVARADPSAPSQTTALGYLAMAYFANGDRPHAIAAQQKAIRIMESSKLAFADSLKNAREQLAKYQSGTPQEAKDAHTTAARVGGI